MSQKADYRHSIGWISNRYPTEEARREGWIARGHENYKDDMRTLNKLKRLGFSAECKSVHAFQITTEKGTCMLYDSLKDGYFIYLPKQKKRIYLEELDKHILDGVFQG